MSKAKLLKFAELATFPNTYQNFNITQPELVDYRSQKVHLKAKWKELVFRNSNPIIMELACGKGEYSLGMAQRRPDRNFIGVDIKGNRIWRGAKTALEENLENVAFLRTDITLLENYFGSGEVSDIWIIFPDPYPKKSKARKRLTSPRFIDIYRKIGSKQTIVHLKTDDPQLFAYSLEVVENFKLDLIHNIRDIYSKRSLPEFLEIKTYYEKMHLEAGKKINYLSFRI